MVKHWNSSEVPSLRGKTALITGANSGIGLPTALELARHGAHVLLACRTPSKAAAAAELIRREIDISDIEMLSLDLASLASIRSLAASLVARGLALDLLINNAGIMALPKRGTTADGFELQIGTNHLGHFALTGLLLPALLAAPEPRVVTVSSIAHRKGAMYIDDLQLEQDYTPWRAYRQSKLANLLFAFELDRRARAQHSRLRSLAAHPGISHTRLVTNGLGSGLKTALINFGMSLLQSAEAGAQPTLYAATEPSLRGGEFIGPDGPGQIRGAPTLVQPNENARNAGDAARLWTLSEQLTGVVYTALN